MYSIPVGINTMSNVQLRMAFKKVGVNYTGRLNPIRTFTKPFRPAKPLWKYDGSSFAAVMLLGITFAIMPNGFSIEVVQNRQVSDLLHLQTAKKALILSDCFLIVGISMYEK